jgi:hypothetical protein
MKTPPSVHLNVYLRPGFLSPLRKESSPSKTKILPPLRPKVTIRDRIGTLCLRLQSLGLTRRPSFIQQAPLRFRFTEEEIFRSRLELPSVKSGYTYDWRTFPTPRVQLLNALQLRRRLMHRSLYKRI